MKNFRNVLWGIALIVAGVIWGLNAIGIINVKLFFDGWWTLFIIVPCFLDLFKEEDKTGNIIGIIIGVALLLASQNVIEFEFVWKMIVPVILVLIGISMILKDTFGNKINSEIEKVNKTQGNKDRCSAIFSGQNVKFDNQEFLGTNLTSAFGGLECDLRKAIITKDVVINANAIFGGIDIFVPSNVKVKIKSTPIFGGVSDETKTEANEDSHTVYINGLALFGGIEVK